GPVVTNPPAEGKARHEAARTRQGDVPPQPGPWPNPRLGRPRCAPAGGGFAGCGCAQESRTPGRSAGGGRGRAARQTELARSAGAGGSVLNSYEGCIIAVTCWNASVFSVSFLLKRSGVRRTRDSVPVRNHALARAPARSVEVVRAVGQVLVP